MENTDEGTTSRELKQGQFNKYTLLAGAEEWRRRVSAHP